MYNLTSKNKLFIPRTAGGDGYPPVRFSRIEKNGGIHDTAPLFIIYEYGVQLSIY